MLSDDPAKGLGQASGLALLSHDLTLIFDDAERHIALVSPYFVPAKSGTEAFRKLERDGVEVLTNALEATDVAAVHAGYAKRRKHQERNPSAGPFGSSGASLHAKTFAVDGERVFVGSFNFDPRSANLNTELGFIIEDPSLAQRIDDAFDNGVPQNAYEVRLDPEGDLYWLERRDGEVIRHDVEPNSGRCGA
ncbi:phospholipase D-like domain-containing protein [Halomonas urmiana]|uniref:phospholipase D-like domain-containing protein n=1 Tax=Halomonas urmiana TaxID=490901 RepID=UPI001F0027C3|nr:phospholipase D-like domain-containing protein [Halomonas urmiana]